MAGITTGFTYPKYLNGKRGRIELRRILRPIFGQSQLLQHATNTSRVLGGTLGVVVLWLFSCTPPDYSGTAKYRRVEKKLSSGKAWALVITNTGSASPGFSEANISISAANAGQRLVLDDSVISNNVSPAFFGEDAEVQPTYAEMPDFDELLAQARNTQGPQYHRSKDPKHTARPKTYNVGDKENFKVQVTGGAFRSRKFFLREKKETDDKSWEVHYWVEENSWKENNTERQDLWVGKNNIDDIAAKFSAKDGILDTSIAIYGSLWGDHKDKRENDYLISGDRKDLHILIFNIFEDGLQGAVLGYFSSCDNMTNCDSSNEKLVLAVDAPGMSRKPDDTYGTLAHELNHMITFYQKRIQRGVRAETWLNEMMAQMANDLVSEKLFPGKKNDFNLMIKNHLRQPWESMTKWDSSVQDYYSITYLAAFLLRSKYAESGAKSTELAKHIQNNNFTDHRAITYATQKLGHSDSWPQILQNYAKAAIKKGGLTATAKTPLGTSGTSSFQLGPIQPFGFQYGSKYGVAMFAPFAGAFEKMPFLGASGKLFRHTNSNMSSNQIQAPKPGGFIYVYLGKYKQDTVLKMTLPLIPKGLEYDIVEFPES